MKHWTAEQIVADGEESADAREILEAVQAALDDEAPSATLVSIGRHEWDDWDDHRFELDVQVEAGLTIRSRFSPIDDGEDFVLDDCVQAAIDNTMEGVSACLAYAEHLSAVVHDARVRARKVVAQWNAEGAPSRLIDVHLAPYDYWRGSRDPVLHVLVEKLSNHLEPVEDRILVQHAGDLEKEMAAELEQLKAGYDTRTALAALGASGTVSRLALNAMSAHGGVSVETLTALGSRGRVELADGIVVINYRGHVSAGTGDLSYPDWQDEQVNLKSLDLSPDEERHAVGRPVSELFCEDFLSDDIVVSSIERKEGEDGSGVTIHYTNPTFLFCGTSGRVWSHEGDASPACSQTNVVLFRARNG